MMPAAEVIPSKPKGVKSSRLSEFPAGHADGHEEKQDAHLDGHHHGVDGGRLARAPDQQQHAEHDQDHGGEVEEPVRLRRVGEVLRDDEAEEVVEQLVEVLRPADGHGGGGDPVLEQQAGGHHDRHSLAQRGVRVGVGGARHRHRAGQLGVADRGEAGDHSREHEGQDDAGPRDRRRRGEDDEDAGADRGPDAEGRQLQQADRARQVAFARVGPRLFRHGGDRLAAQDLLPQRCHRSPSSSVTQCR